MSWEKCGRLSGRWLIIDCFYGRNKRKGNVPQGKLAQAPPAPPAPPHQSTHLTPCRHLTAQWRECLDGPAASPPEPQHLKVDFTTVHHKYTWQTTARTAPGLETQSFQCISQFQGCVMWNCTWDTRSTACGSRERLQGKLDVLPWEAHLHQLEDDG